MECAGLMVQVTELPAMQPRPAAELACQGPTQTMPTVKWIGVFPVCTIHCFPNAKRPTRHLVFFLVLRGARSNNSSFTFRGMLLHAPLMSKTLQTWLTPESF